MSGIRRRQRAHAQQLHAQQRAQAEQRRLYQHMLLEEDRLRKEAERAAAAKHAQERRRLYAEARAARVATENTNLRARIEELENILAWTLEIDDHVDLEQLKERVELEPFDPGELAVPRPAPDWRRFAPPDPTTIGKMLGGEARYQQELATARAAFEKAQAKHAAAEADRQRRLAEARRAYERRRQQLEAEVAAHNAEIDRFATAVSQGKPDAVVEYFGLVLGNSVYPADFPQQYRLAYLPQSRQIVVEYHLPTTDVIPQVREYRYIRARDETITTPRSEEEINQRYADVLAQVTLRTVHELFEADRGGLIVAIAFNGIVETVDPRTGHRVRPCLVTLRATRDTFTSLNLANVDAIACLRHLRAAVSSRPHALEAVRPVVDFNTIDNGFVDAANILAELDQRPNLLGLSTDEFEGVVQTLFTRLGLQIGQLRVTSDGGVDCVAVDSRPLFGGKVVVHARRGPGLVDVAAVRDLYGSVLAEGASKGILVATGGYTAASFEFASGKPLELVDGSTLLHLLAEHAGFPARIEPVTTS